MPINNTGGTSSLEKIENKTETGSNTSVTFNTGLSGYAYYLLVCNVRTDAVTNRTFEILINNDTAGNPYVLKVLSDSAVALVSPAGSLQICAKLSSSDSFTGSILFPASKVGSNMQVGVQGTGGFGANNTISALYTGSGSTITSLVCRTQTDHLVGTLTLYGLKN